MPALDELYSYIMRDPRLREAFAPNSGPQADPMSDKQRMGQVLSEAGAVGDPFGATAIQRLLGIPIHGNVLVNEGHGLVNNMNMQNWWNEQKQKQR